MRPVAQLSLLFIPLLFSGCQSFDPTRLWKLNRGEDYMNNDQYFSIPLPVAAPHSPPLDVNTPE